MADADRRLFFALWPGDRERAELTGLQRDLPIRRGRLTHPSDLHVTLVFLGGTSEERLPCVIEAGSRAGGTSFELYFDRVGYWPRPRIVWCAPSAKPDSLKSLVKSLSVELGRCGFVPERRPHAPHVTLARNASAEKGLDLDTAIAWPVREFTLVSSNPGGPPPRYSMVHRWALAG